MSVTCRSALPGHAQQLSIAANANSRPNTQADDVAASELTVDRKVENGEIAHLMGVLQVDADEPLRSCKQSGA